MLLEDAFPTEIHRMMNLQAIGWWTGAFFALAAIGGVLGGWLSGRLLNKGWSLNAARKVTFLICALAVVPVLLAPMAGTAWLAVLIIGFVGYFTGGFMNGFTGYIVQETGSYTWVFVYFSGTYVVSLLAMQLLVPKIEMTKARQ